MLLEEKRCQNFILGPAPKRKTTSTNAVCSKMWFVNFAKNFAKMFANFTEFAKWFAKFTKFVILFPKLFTKLAKFAKKLR